jgi:hypothetical protein
MLTWEVNLKQSIVLQGIQRSIIESKPEVKTFVLVLAFDGCNDFLFNFEISLVIIALFGTMF